MDCLFPLLQKKRFYCKLPSLGKNNLLRSFDKLGLRTLFEYNFVYIIIFLTHTSSELTWFAVVSYCWLKLKCVVYVLAQE